MEGYLDPLQNAVNVFQIIWNHIPDPVRYIFYVGLALVFMYALYRLLSR